MTTGDMLARESFCGCPGLEPPPTYGRSGWHWQRSESTPAHPQTDVAFERCPAYRGAVERRRSARGATGESRRGGR